MKWFGSKNSGFLVLSVLWGTVDVSVNEGLQDPEAYMAHLEEASTVQLQCIVTIFECRLGMAHLLTF